MTPLHRKLLRDAWHLRGQLAAVALVVASGVALFVTLRSMHGYLLGTRDAYYRAYRFADVFAHLERAPLGTARRLSAIPGVAAVEPRIVADVLVSVPGLDEPATARLVSLPPSGQPSLDRLHLRSGRWPAPGRTEEVIASDAFARANHFALGSRLEAVIHGRWQPLWVVGTAISPEFVYEIKGGDLFPDNRRFGVLWMERPALEAAFDLQGSFDDVALRLAPGASLPAVVAAVDAVLERFGGLGAFGREEQVSHRFLSDEIAETQVTSLLLPAIFLGVTAFLLHLVMGRLVALQREQIAVLKAFGYGNPAVAAHYLGLALVPVTVGVLAGGAIGVWLAAELAGVYDRFFQFPPTTFVPRISVLATAALVMAGAALLGALSTVRRVVALAPAEAMRPDAPPEYRASRLERSGLGRRLPLAGRIVARNLSRRPGKAALTVLGTATAIAIVFTGRNLWDAVEVLEQVVFERVQRQDLLVTFRQPLAEPAARALARLPGVRRVEPFRAVAAEVRHGSRRRRVALMALDRDAELWRIVDRDGRRHALPFDGVLLTTALADVLRARPGDELTVAVREGRRPTLALPVAGLADEVVGTAVYVDRDGLRRWLADGALVSGAMLAVDRRAEPALLARLARLPAIGSVTSRRAALASFESTLQESFLISILSMLGFACVIAVGIVYNGARVALSERGRELASLRVLGFTRREVATMLLGEQGLLLLLAVPVGLALGASLCALVAYRFSTELFRLPFVLRAETALVAVGVVAAAAVVSSLLVRRRLDRLDLVAVLKTRE